MDEREIEDRGGGIHSVPREIEGEADGGGAGAASTTEHHDDRADKTRTKQTIRRAVPSEISCLTIE